MKPIVTGILSFGMSGRIFHAPFIAAHPGFSLHAFVERTTKRVNAFYPDAISYDSVAELLADESIELVIVNTPNNTHEELARQCLLAGKHVLVEKPFASSLAAAKSLYELAESSGKYILVYQNRRWDSDFLSVRAAIESGALGRLIEVNFRFDRYKKELSPKKFKEEALPASGLTYDLGPHVIDQVISLFGTPTSASKISGTYRPGSIVDDYVSWRLSYPGKLTVNVTSSLLTAEPSPAFILHGENGSYVKTRADVQEAQLDKSISPLDPIYGSEAAAEEGLLVTYDEQARKTSIRTRTPKGDYMCLFDAVHGQLRKNEPYPITKEDILCQLSLLELASDN